MKVTLYMAMTANGIIARENGDEDFLSDINWRVFCQLAKKIGCFVVGRKTYDAVNKWPDYNFDNVKASKIIVSKKPRKLKNGYIAAKSPADALKKAAKAGFKQVLVTGGGKINSAFMKTKRINEIILDIEPAVLGKGIRIFAEAPFESRLALVKVKKLPSQIVQLHYRVKK